MPITQDQMLEQVRESRANHAEMKALRELVLTYVESAKARYPTNIELQEVLSALDVTLRLRPVPDDRATYMNERYYSRFARRNAKAKEKQALIRAGAFIPQERNISTKPRAKVREAGQQAFARSAPIMPRSYPDDKPLEFESQAPDFNQREENLPSGPSFGLDIPPDPYDNDS